MGHSKTPIGEATRDIKRGGNSAVYFIIVANKHLVESNDIRKFEISPQAKFDAKIGACISVFYQLRRISTKAAARISRAVLYPSGIKANFHSTNLSLKDYR